MNYICIYVKLINILYLASEIEKGRRKASDIGRGREKESGRGKRVERRKPCNYYVYVSIILFVYLRTI